MLGKDT